MREQLYEIKTIPDVVLILGTDGAGKDHVANILENMIREAGGTVQKRRGFMSGRPSHTKDSTRKSYWQQAQERVFLALYSRVGPLLPLAASGIIRLDSFLFKRPAQGKLIVVGHHGLRALAFYFGQEPPRSVDEHLEKAFRFMRSRTKVHTVVIDVHSDIRRQRLALRDKTGDQDFFDRFMLNNDTLCEEIEARLIGLAQKYFDAALITNDDLSDDEIIKKLSDSFRGRGG